MKSILQFLPLFLKFLTITLGCFSSEKKHKSIKVLQQYSEFLFKKNISITHVRKLIQFKKKYIYIKLFFLCICNKKLQVYFCNNWSISHKQMLCNFVQLDFGLLKIELIASLQLFVVLS